MTKRPRTFAEAVAAEDPAVRERIERAEVYRPLRPRLKGATT
jgi:hypothetical protein